jgi:hypothetical protein
MRPILLAAFAILTFLMVLTIAQSALGLESPQMRLFLVPIIGLHARERYAPGLAAKDALAYLISAIAAGAVIYRLGRLMYLDA